MPDTADSAAESSMPDTEAAPAWLGLGRAIGGAIIFGLPMMMTMEMWWIGFYIRPERLALLVLFSLPLFVGLARLIGFEKTSDFWNSLIDVFVAYAVAFATTGLVLILFAVITPDTSLGEGISMVILQTVPATLGALLARSQIGSEKAEQKKPARRYSNELVIMITGALFLAFNMAPTEEMVMISYMMTAWHILALTLFTLLVVHLFSVSHTSISLTDVYRPATHGHTFIRFTSVGYVLAFCVCFFILWVFGRTDNESVGNLLNTVVVLNFPAAVGAAASRLII